MYTSFGMDFSEADAVEREQEQEKLPPIEEIEVPDSETEVEQVAYLGGWPSYDLYRHHHGVAEFSVVGCANVGKSSLLNMITGIEIARHGMTKGVTKMIHKFMVDSKWYLVDLPGFGGTLTSTRLDARQQWQATIEYLCRTPNLVATLFLVDITNEDISLAKHYLKYLVANRIPIILVFTKLDKC